MNFKLSYALMLNLLILPLSGKTQICLDSYTTEECPYRIIGEFGILKHVNTMYERNSGTDFEINLGIQKRMKKDFSMGVYLFSNLTVGGSGSAVLQTGMRPRFAYKIKPNVETSFSPGITLSSTLDHLNSFKGLSFEGSISWNNQVGVVMKYDRYYSDMRGHDSVLSLGLQTHGTTTFYSIGGFAVGIPLFYLLFNGFFGI